MINTSLNTWVLSQRFCWNTEQHGYCSTTPQIFWFVKVSIINTFNYWLAKNQTFYTGGGHNSIDKKYFSFTFNPKQAKDPSNATVICGYNKMLMQWGMRLFFLPCQTGWQKRALLSSDCDTAAQKDVAVGFTHLIVVC